MSPPPRNPLISTSTAGFTLIELSVVLVIIGLIAGSILLGQSLIHQAQVRAVITQEVQLQTAAATFREKYQSLPGDLANASNFGFMALTVGGTEVTNGACKRAAKDVGCPAFPINSHELLPWQIKL